jgi:hypothetical protein
MLLKRTMRAFKSLMPLDVLDPLGAARLISTEQKVYFLNQ